MTSEITDRTRLLVGGAVALIAGIVIIILSQLFLFSEYQVILKGFFDEGKKAAVVMQSFEQPIFSQILALGGLLMAVGGYGFLIKREWAFLVAIIGATMSVFASFLLTMFPLMVLLPMKHIPTLLISVAAWFVLTIYVKQAGAKVVAFSFACGMALTMTFMNGNAALNKWIGAHLKLQQMNPDMNVAFIKVNAEYGGLMFQGIQQILWVGFIGFFVVTIAVLYRKKWALPVALGSAVISIAAGTPVAYVDTVVDKAGESLSMFSFAPILSTVILILLLVFREKIWSKPEDL